MPLPGRVFTPAPVAKHPLNEGLLAWWLGLPDTSGGPNVFNLTQRTGSVTLSGTVPWVAGPNGFSAVQYDGISAHSTFALDLSAYSSVMVSGWLYPVALPVGAGNFTMFWELTDGGLTTPGGFALYYAGTPGEGLSLAQQGSGGGQRNYTYGAVISTGQWYWIDVIYSLANNMQLYVNGVLQTPNMVQNNTGSGTFANSNFNIAARNSTTLFFNGRYSGMRIIGGREPSAGEVDGNYAQNLLGNPDTLNRSRSKLVVPVSQPVVTNTASVWLMTA